MPLPERAPAQRTLMRDEAYRALRGLIVSGTLAPAERLRDKDLAAWLGVSRTPVREALTRLADDGLVEFAANRYTRVTPLRVQDALDGYRLAAALQALAAEMAGTAMDAELLNELDSVSERYAWALLRDDDEELVASDDAFHALLIEAANSEQLERLLDRVVPRLRQLELTLAPGLGSRRPNIHGALIEVLREGDREAAASLVTAEWRELGALVVSAAGQRDPALTV